MIKDDVGLVVESMTLIAKDSMDKTVQMTFEAAARLADAVAKARGSAADCASAIREVAGTLAANNERSRS